MHARSRAFPSLVSLVVIAVSACSASDDLAPGLDASTPAVEVRPSPSDGDVSPQTPRDIMGVVDPAQPPGAGEPRRDANAEPRPEADARDAPASDASDAARDATSAPDAATEAAVPLPGIDSGQLCPDGFPKGTGGSR